MHSAGFRFAVRQLDIDDEEVLFKVVHPILLNGMEDVVRRPDLGDRASSDLGANWRRRPEAELWREFEIARPACWAPCSTRWSTACVPWAAFSSTCHPAWSYRASRRLLPGGAPQPSGWDKSPTSLSEENDTGDHQCDRRLGVGLT
jgi:hypothetical protein